MRDVISLFIKCVKSAASTIKNSSVRAKRGMFAVVAVIAIFAGLSFTGTRIAYNVSYDGHIIATVGSKKQFAEAVAKVQNIVDSDGVHSVVAKPQFNATIVLSHDIDNTDAVADAIICNTTQIVEATVLSIDGQAVIRAEKSMVETMINDRLAKYNTSDSKCNVRFEQEIALEYGYFVVSDLDDAQTVESAINSLNVIAEVTKVTDVMVPYKSITKNSNELVIGTSEVSVVGTSGIDRITQEIVMINGNVVSDVTVSTESVIDPVDEVILKGTAKTLASAEEAQKAHNAGFIFPLPDGTWRVSSYYGDGRNHKGVDICAKGGTSIYAVADGTVVYSGWRGNYGNCVIIEHENGLKTLYAHAKKVCCSAGDVVSQGDEIALVGTTGQSTGNHLHFEVTVNGYNKDPAPYINLD